MDDGNDALARAIGDRVRDARTTRRLTLDQVAASAGVSRRMLVNVEQGSANPSIGTLLRLAGALGVGLPALVEPPRAETLSVVRDGDAPTLWSTPAGGYGRLVASAGSHDVTELWEWMLAPGDARESDSHSPGTRELIHVLEGSITVTADGRRVTLAAGDAVAFPGDVPHAYANPNGERALFSLAVSDPGAPS
ncbi:helix-turn-helix domain-containing protein [Marisediminicola sp. LYQ85]|uniref:helix-turn-helix domain-containing protein n=1 Tax=Marisediminicola sp. LYQ85 TaxID=3391062 RepID=UPI003983974D